MQDPATIKKQIQAHALREGFDAVRFSTAEAASRNREGLTAYLEAGHHGNMEWMEARAGERADPKHLWEEAKSVVMLGLNYGPDHDPLAILKERNKGAISIYAQGDDYHDLVKKKLK